MSKVQFVNNNRESFQKILSAVDKLVNLIKPTFGPASNKVIIKKQTHMGVFDDGVQIARDLELDDKIENAAMQIAREVSIRTNDRVGDGTTGSLILLQAILNEIAKDPNFNGREIEKELKAGLEECKEQLMKMAKPVKTKEQLRKVTRVSFDDEKIANTIADAWHDLGENGVLTVDNSPTMETFVDLTDGLKIESGYVSPYMVTNPSRMEAVMEKPLFLITDYRLTEVSDIAPIMEKLMQGKQSRLVVLCENIEQKALAMLVVNRMQQKFDGMAVAIPSKNREQFLADLAILTGGKFFSEKKGDKLENATVEDLGKADRFIARNNETVIIGPRGNQKKIKDAIKALNAAYDVEKIEKNREEIKERIALFSNKIGVVKVGAATENEQKALKYKVEDAVHSTHAAFKGGVAPGGGTALRNLKTSSEILHNALQVPFRQLKLNVGIRSHGAIKQGEALNVVTGEIGPWQKVGVMDPVDVLVAQLEGAVSIASLFATTSGLLVEDPDYLKTEK